MKTIQNYKAIPDGQVFGLIPNLGQSLMGGFTRIDQDKNGLVRVHYEDGTIEARNGAGVWDLPNDSQSESFNIFSVLSWVQDAR